MPIEIQLPRLGWSMEEGKFVAWLKQPGERVKAGEPLFTLESDKAAQDVESTDSGILALAPDAPQPGDVVTVGRVLGWLLAEGEHAPAASPQASPTDSGRPAESFSEPNPQSKSAGLPAAEDGQIPASPRARRAAREHHVDLKPLTPTGKGGRIRERDVLAVAKAQLTSASSIAVSGMKALPVSQTRRTIAARLMHSRQTTVPVTITCRSDATQLVALRRQLKAEGEAGKITLVPTLNDILVKLTGAALRQHPLLTGVWAEDRILVPDTIHIGIAVDVNMASTSGESSAAGESALIVPVIRDVCSASLAHIAAQSQKLIAAARAGTLTAADMQGACFTVSNLGTFGIETFTPVINPPESAILGIGAIVREAVPLDDGSFAARERMSLSLTFDHRVIDGAPAARFLQSLRQLIEQPFLGLV